MSRIVIIITDQEASAIAAAAALVEVHAEDEPDMWGTDARALSRVMKKIHQSEKKT